MDNGLMMYVSGKAVRLVDDTNKATHWIPSNEDLENCEMVSVTPNKLYRLFEDKYEDELVIINDDKDLCHPFPVCAGYYVIMEQ
jgi:hypothetical protein